MKNTKSLISVLLALVMLFSVCSVSFSATAAESKKNLLSTQDIAIEKFFSKAGFAFNSSNGESFADGQTAPEAMVFEFLNMTEELNDYFDEEWATVISYDDYMKIANSYFVNAPEMKEYLNNEGYLLDDGETVKYHIGGKGDLAFFVMTDGFVDRDSDTGVIKQQLRGIFCYDYAKTEGKTEWCDYYVDSYGEAFNIKYALELTLEETEEYGYRIESFIKKDYYVADTEDKGECVFKYNTETESFSDVYYRIKSDAEYYGYSLVLEDNALVKFDNVLCYKECDKINWKLESVENNVYTCDGASVEIVNGKTTKTNTDKTYGSFVGNGEATVLLSVYTQFDVISEHCTVKEGKTVDYYGNGVIELTITPDAGYEILAMSAECNGKEFTGQYIEADNKWIVCPDFKPGTITVATMEISDGSSVIRTGMDSVLSIGVVVSDSDKEKFDGLNLTIKELTQDEQKKASGLLIKKLGTDESQFDILDISFEKADGTQEKVNAEMVVAIPVPDGWDATGIAIYYVNPETGEVTDMNAIVSEDGKTLSFTTNHFSFYAMVQEDYKPGDVNGDGKITAADARLALRASVELEKYEKGSRKYNACDVDGKKGITAADARLILRASVELEDLK